LKIVPSHLQALLASAPGASVLPARWLILGGEAFPVRLLEELRARGGTCRILNHYGPTETTVGASVLDVEVALAQGAAPWRTVPIGRPLDNVRLYVLDRHQQPVPIGVEGELYIGGAGVARGYLDKPDVTAQRFVAEPFSGGQERLYRTGDRVRLLRDGSVEFLGRMDHQVKVRGYRIETGEIEAVLARHPNVERVLVVPRAGGGGTRLVAYVTHRDTQPAPAALRAHLAEYLPEHMLPSDFVLLESFPRNLNGKVDLAALPEPADTAGSEADAAPRTGIEEQLAALWMAVLGLGRVRADDDFFALGGHSLLAMQLVSRIRECFRIDLPLRALFEARTPRALAARVGQAASSTRTDSIPHLSPRPSPAPLSYAQHRLWFLERLSPSSAFYHMPLALQLEGALSVEALARSVNALLERHAILRTVYPTDSGEPRQHVLEHLELPLPVLELPAEATGSPGDWLEARMREEAAGPFALATGPLVRASLLRLSPERHVLLLTMHHIASDGWSMGVLVRELGSFYAAFIGADSRPLPPLRLDYVDFACWQRERLEGGLLEQQLHYWRGQLAGCSGVIELPTDKPRPPVQAYQGATVSALLPRHLSEALEDLSRREGVTLYMTLKAAFDVLLYRWTGQEDFTVGTPIAGRDNAELEELIGLFVNTLVLRADLSGEPTFRELLHRVRETALGAYTHQDIPFERLVQELRPERNLAHAPLFQVMFMLRNFPEATARLPGLTLSLLESGTRTAKFDLTLAMTATQEGLATSLEYNTDLFEEATVRRMLGQLRVLLEGIAREPGQHVSRLPLLSEEERHRLLVEWNDTAVDFPREACLHQLVEAQVERTPGAVALVFEGQSLTYRELDARANQLAWHLRSLGVGPEVRVGLCLERSLEMVIALLATLKAGGAYVPLDPDYPTQRLVWMLEDARPAVLLAQQRLLSRLPQHDARVLCLDSRWEEVAAHPRHAPPPLATPDNLAYVIFTSGSTGRPKGAMNAHAPVCNRLLWMQDEYGLGPQDTVLQKTPFSFDVSVWEFFWPLMVGARLVVARPGGHQEPAYLVELIAEARITTLHFVPSMLQLFLEEPGLERCASLRRVVCSGEALPLELAERCLQRLPQAGLHNLYGPTEAAVDVTHYACVRGEPRRSVPIGRPVANTSIRLLDSKLRPVPIGVPGELFIGGVQVGRGYLSRSELTAERFIPDPLSETLGARLYRTGDVARWLPDGNIEYLGRADFQVKIRGLRIELGEIESTLEKHPTVQQAVVLAREDVPGDKRLVAYVRAQAGGEPEPAALREYLKQRLPTYMVPASFVVLAHFPMLASGKV
ncbi:amino acid adenylation domain-containing protein, partial [Archangium sp.]|uniref:amino acid adenylation domain-containing protein n=1 Tax=Archangium sp. TaxID=1872627 RepID=UPI00389AEF3C